MTEEEKKEVEDNTAANTTDNTAQEDLSNQKDAEAVLDNTESEQPEAVGAQESGENENITTTVAADEHTAAETIEDISDEAGSHRNVKRSRNRKKRIGTRDEKPASEWSEQVVQISRVTKVVKGGKKLSFRAIVVVGNKKGQVGIGCAKASEVIVAIQKAIADGRKNLVTVPIFKTTIPHPITGRSGAGAVMLRPASKGTGIIAGGSVRSVLELAGIENILSKSLGSNSPLNAANAALNALKSLTPFREVAKKRGLTMAELLN